MFDRILPFFFPPYVFPGVMIQESNKYERSCKLFISSFSEWELGNGNAKFCQEMGKGENCQCFARNSLPINH